MVGRGQPLLEGVKLFSYSIYSLLFIGLSLHLFLLFLYFRKPCPNKGFGVHYFLFLMSFVFPFPLFISLWLPYRKTRYGNDPYALSKWHWCLFWSGWSAANLRSFLLWLLFLFIHLTRLSWYLLVCYLFHLSTLFVLIPRVAQCFIFFFIYFFLYSGFSLHLQSSHSTIICLSIYSGWVTLDFPFLPPQSVFIPCPISPVCSVIITNPHLRVKKNERSISAAINHARLIFMFTRGMKTVKRSAKETSEKEQEVTYERDRERKENTRQIWHVYFLL